MRTCIWKRTWITWSRGTDASREPGEPKTSPSFQNTAENHNFPYLYLPPVPQTDSKLCTPRQSKRAKKGQSSRYEDYVQHIPLIKVQLRYKSSDTQDGYNMLQFGRKLSRFLTDVDWLFPVGLDIKGFSTHTCGLGSRFLLLNSTSSSSSIPPPHGSTVPQPTQSHIKPQATHVWLGFHGQNT